MITREVGEVMRAAAVPCEIFPLSIKEKNEIGVAPDKLSEQSGIGDDDGSDMKSFISRFSKISRFVW